MNVVNVGSEPVIDLSFELVLELLTLHASGLLIRYDAAQGGSQTLPGYAGPHSSSEMSPSSSPGEWVIAKETVSEDRGAVCRASKTGATA